MAAVYGDEDVGAEVTPEERAGFRSQIEGSLEIAFASGLWYLEKGMRALLRREEQLTTALRVAAERFDFIAERLPGAAAYAIDARFALGEASPRPAGEMVGGLSTTTEEELYERRLGRDE